MQPVITCSQLRHNYGEKEVLHGLDFTVKQGGIVGLLGKNGAGKSTTINILMGFLRPQSGHCTVLGYPSHSIPEAARSRIGLLHEGFIQYDFMTIEQIEKFYAPFYPNWNKGLYYDLVNRLTVPHTRRISRLSCGQRSQITLGLILAQTPELMILDDYSMGLDVGYRRLFLEFLRDFVDAHTTTVLLTSHIVQELDSFLDQVIVVQEGNIIVNQTKNSFMENFYQYHLPVNERTRNITQNEVILSTEIGKNNVSIFSFAKPEAIRSYLSTLGVEKHVITSVSPIPMNLEDAFVGLTGRY